MISCNPQIVNIMNQKWYVESQTGLDGPFETEKEASVFLRLVQSSNAARMEFAGLQYSPQNY